jgi:hypothetical protein
MYSYLPVVVLWVYRMDSSDQKPQSGGQQNQGALSALASLLIQLFAAYVVVGTKTHAEAGNHKGPSDATKKRPRDWMAIFTAASAFGALLAAVFSGWAAYENHNSVHEANRATRASVWLQVLADYETADMLSSINFLRQWQSHTPSFEKRFYELLTAKDLGKEDSELSKHIDSDRRRVIKFFDKLRILTQGDIIDTYFVSQNWDSGTYTYINDVLAPLHREKLQAMLDTKALTPTDFAAANHVLADILTFYYNTVVAKKASPVGAPRIH